MVKKLANLFLRSILSAETFARRQGVVIGERCRILTKHFGSEPFLISIGNHVTVSHGVTFVNHDGAGWLVNDSNGRRYSYRRIAIGDNCFIGANSTIMPGIKIGDRVIVGAGSIVTRSVPDGWVVAGNPARKIMSFDEFCEKANRWVTSQDLDLSATYRDRVLKVTDESFRPPLA